MNLGNSTRSRATQTPMKLLVLALGMMLALGLLSACGQQASDESESSAAADTAATSTVDTASWKTLGDAFAAKTDDVASSWDSNYYVTTFKAGDSLVRVVAKSNEDADNKIAELDFLDKDYDSKLLDIIGGLEIVSAEDLTAGVPTQDELDALVGKTGQEIMDDGWTFQSYFMTGGDETAATYAKDYYAVNLTFDANISSDKADKDVNGDEMKAAKVSAAENAGVSDAAVDPTLVK